ncbi:antitoxin [Arthrobacter sp. H14]|uniref:antitoxin n=1 Tax=Arthrobacter sp. H14 TaxID=1312959 RepID=UPI0004B455B4|nr:antitoxin [Arthrobacter sp. H14]
MSVFDGFKGKASGLKGKATDLIGQHEGKIQKGIQKAGDFADRKSGGKYAGKIDGVREKASGFVEKNANRGDSTDGTSGPVPGP